MIKHTGDRKLISFFFVFHNDYVTVILVKIGIENYKNCFVFTLKVYNLFVLYNLFQNKRNKILNAP